MSSQQRSTSPEAIQSTSSASPNQGHAVLQRKTSSNGYQAVPRTISIDDSNNNNTANQIASANGVGNAHGATSSKPETPTAATGTSDGHEKLGLVGSLSHRAKLLLTPHRKVGDAPSLGSSLLKIIKNSCAQCSQCPAVVPTNVSPFTRVQHTADLYPRLST